jgi:hypothetical protein
MMMAPRTREQKQHEHRHTKVREVRHTLPLAEYNNFCLLFAALKMNDQGAQELTLPFIN